jgi:tetratricopeptide (TPR) repeat protein
MRKNLLALLLLLMAVAQARADVASPVEVIVGQMPLCVVVAAVFFAIAVALVGIRLARRSAAQAWIFLGAVGVFLVLTGGCIGWMVHDNRVERNEARAARLEEKKKQKAAEAALRMKSWEVVKDPGRSKESYQQALQEVKEAYRLDPDNEYLLATLGAAQYRTENYRAALQSFKDFEQFDTWRPPSLFSLISLAFLAMTHHQLGEFGQGKDYLTRLRKVRLGEITLKEIEDSRPLFREAEQLIEGDPKSR